MYKKLSEWQQDQSRRAAVVSHENTGGVDPTAFKQTDETKESDGADERDRLVLRKREIEHAVRMLRESIAHAQRQFAKTQQFEPHYNQWIATRSRLINELMDIDRSLMRLRVKFRREKKENESQKTTRDLSYEAVFVRVAKEILADPVYDRICVATIHRLRETKTDEHR
jgi:hypothetical protein